MNYAERQKHYAKIEKERKTKVITFVTSDRQGMETAIAPDCIDLFVDLLDKLGPIPKISLILHTNGGSTLAAWRLVNLGHADLPHPALGQELTLSRATPSAVSGHFSELIGCPISKVLPCILRLS